MTTIQRTLASALMAVMVALGIALAPAAASAGSLPTAGSTWVEYPTHHACADPWPMQNPLVAQGHFYDLCVSPGSGRSIVLTSRDGRNWKEQPTFGLPNGQQWWRTSYAHGLYVAVRAYNTAIGGRGAPLTSRNGLDFGSRSYQVATSRDGVTWKTHIAPIGLWTDVTYGDGRFVAVGNSTGLGTHIVMTSRDGMKWSAVNSPAAMPDDTTQLNNVAYVHGVFIATAYEPGSRGYEVMTSPNGLKWTGDVVPTGSYSAPAIAYGNGTWAILGGTSTQAVILTSRNKGRTWKETVLQSTTDWTGMVYVNHEFVATADLMTTPSSSLVMTSPDAVTWKFGSAPNQYWWSLVANKGLLLSLSEDGTQSMVSYVTPSAPSNLITQISNNAMTVRWNIPDENGIAPVVHYVVNVSAGTKSLVNVSTSGGSRHTWLNDITGLDPTQRYTVTVTAVNRYGEGVPMVLRNVRG